MFAIVKISGKQYPVEPEHTVVVDHVDGNEGDTVTFEDVLLVSDGKKTTVGTPTVKNAKVTATIVRQFRGEKIAIRRYKQKVRYRKARGFRAEQTEFKIQSIA